MIKEPRHMPKPTFRSTTDIFLSIGFVKDLCFITVFILTSVGSSFSQDTTAPTITIQAQDGTTSCGGSTNSISDLVTWYDAHASAQATDASGTVIWTADLTVEQAIQIFTSSADTLCGRTRNVVVAFRALDAVGNQSIPTIASFSSIDTVGPVISNQASNVMRSCQVGIRDSLINWIQQYGGYQAIDACSESVIWTSFNYQISSNGVVIVPNTIGNINTGPYPQIPSNSCQWTVNATFTVQDQCGNETITSTTIFTVIDDVPPTFINPPANITVACGSSTNPAIVTATDVCSSNPTIVVASTSTQSTDPKLCQYYNYTVSHIWTASDACGNTSTHSQVVTVEDKIAPTILGDPNPTVSCEIFADNPDSIFLKSVVDQCASPVNVTFTESILPGYCANDHLRRYTSTDVCNNSSVFDQLIFVSDNLPPVITKPASNKTFSCTSTDPIDGLLITWMDSLGGSMAVTGCGSMRSFAALKGSYILNDPTTFPGTKPTTIPTQSCPSPLLGFLRYVEVDFVFHDTCGNATMTSAVFGVADSNGPTVTNCPPKQTINADPTSCDGRISLMIPTATDDCTESMSPITRTVSARLQSNSPGNLEAIVFPVTLKIGPLNPTTAAPLSNANIKIKLSNMDIDDVTEYFEIVGENGVSLGRTPAGINAGQCQTQEITLNISQANIATWIQDGFITLVFNPNIVAGIPIASINDFCANSTIEASISYEINTTNTIRRSISIDGGDSLDIGNIVMIDTTLDVGNHIIDFMYLDCANNRTSCKVAVEIKDVTAPTITCPSDIVIDLPMNSCKLGIKIPLTLMVDDNCQLTQKTELTAPSTQDGSLINYSFSTVFNANIANSKQLIFKDVSPIRYTATDVAIQVEFLGDNNDTGEYWEILGPGGYLLGRTTKRDSDIDCGTSSVTFTVPSAIFNSWIINNEVILFALPNDIPGAAGNGINPCIPLNNGQTIDGIAKLTAKITYEDAALTASMSGSTINSTINISIDSTHYTIFVNGGETYVKFETKDQSGNVASCTTKITVSDAQKPIAKCKNSIITIHPSGLINTMLDPMSIDNGSTDNCQIDTAYTDIKTVDCSQVGQDVNVKLYVQDKAKNIDSCLAIVKVNPTVLMPTYESGLCANDTIKFFANVPMASVQGTYTFEWKGPATFFDENPIVAGVNESYNGNYVLTVKGFGGCTTMGSVNVNVKPLINPSLTVLSAVLCENDDLILNTTNYVGNIKYLWYEGISPTGVLVKQTEVSDLIIKPSVGVHFYYMIAEGFNCKSNASNLLKITVLKQPVAEVNDRLLTPCEGETITLGSPTNNPNFIYQWQGPSYNATGQFPATIPNATQNNSGVYTLVIKNDICVSDTITTTVEVFNTPDKPSISALQVYCSGATIQMQATQTQNADKYEWYKDGVLFTTTLDGALVLTNAQPGLQGKWSVKAFEGRCASPISDDFFIAVEVLLSFGASNDGPVCAGDSIQLLATFIPNATYTWDGPGQNDNIPSIHDPKILAIEGDYAVTITTPTSCKSNATTSVKIISLPQITAISSDATPCLNLGQDITFFPSIFPVNNSFTYKWTGPNFSSNIKNPKISSPTPQDTGTYTLIVLNQGCPSEPVELHVDFLITPPKPLISASSFICQGDSLKIFVSNQIPSVSYQWLTPNGGTLLTTVPQLIIANPSAINNGEYTVSMINGACKSVLSDVAKIEIRPKPSQPSISSNSPVCHGDNLLLQSSTSATGYTWLFNDVNVVGNTQNLTFANASPALNGKYTMIVSKDGCESEVSTALQVIVKDAIKTPEFTTTNLTICTTDPSVELCLNPNSLQANGLIELTNATGQILTTTKDMCFQFADLNKLNQGTNFVYLTSSFDGCKSPRSTPVIVSLRTPPALQATIVEGDISVCPDDLAKLTSKLGNPTVDIQWSAIGQGPTIINSNMQIATFENLMQGINRFELSYSVVGCQNFSRDTATVFLSYAPTLMQDVYVLPYGQNGTYDITQNDVIPDDATISIISGPQYGKATLVDGQLIYEPDPRYIESQIFTYEVCPVACPDLCQRTTVIIDFESDIACKIPNLLTPNNDGINDLLLIPCLGDERYPESRISIFNEWGQEVYNDQPYGNDWDGTYAGAHLPVGTYFVVLEVSKGSKPINGFIVIQR